MSNALRETLARGQFITAPGVFDMMSAIIADKVGFDFIYASGFWLTASHLGLPDAGIATYTQMLDRMSTLSATSSATIIADADTGYGGLLNVHHTVRGYEQAGIAAVQIEDQIFPKKCGHTRNKQVVRTAEMVAKIKVACEARRNPDTVIIARTDTRQVEGFEAALERARAFEEAGADIIFMEALESVEEMKIACRAATRPMMANMVEGGKTPVLSPNALQEIGYSLAIYPATTSLAALSAIETALRTLKDPTRADNDAELFDFSEMCSLLGFDEVWDFESRWSLV